MFNYFTFPHLLQVLLQQEQFQSGGAVHGLLLEVDVGDAELLVEELVEVHGGGRHVQLPALLVHFTFSLLCYQSVMLILFIYIYRFCTFS